MGEKNPEQKRPVPLELPKKERPDIRKPLGGAAIKGAGGKKP